MRLNPRKYHLLAPESELDVCDHGRPDHQALIRELAAALGLDLPALDATPAQVWAGLLGEVRAIRSHVTEWEAHIGRDASGVEQ